MAAVLLVVGALAMSVGIGAEWGWPIGLMTAGGLALAAGVDASRDVLPAKTPEAERGGSVGDAS